MMAKPKTKRSATTLKGVSSLLIALMVALTVITAGCRAVPQHANPQEQPLLSSSIENFIRVPLCRQATGYTCGVASLQSILYYYGEEWREDKLAKELKSDPEKGTDYRNIVKLAQSRGLQAEVHTDMTIDTLKSVLHNKKPIIVALQAWSDNPSDYAGDWNDGHYAVAIGYDDDRIYFMDPSTLGNYTFIVNEEFLKRWHDTDSDNETRLVHFGIIIRNDKPTYNPNIVLAME